MASQEDIQVQWQSHYCQCCLSSTSGFYKDVTAEYYLMGVKEVYEDMLYTIFRVNLLSEGKDRRICEACINKLREASRFKKLVLESQLTIVRSINNADSTKEAQTVNIKVEDNTSSCDEDCNNDAVDSLEGGAGDTVVVKIESCSNEELPQKPESIQLPKQSQITVEIPSTSATKTPGENAKAIIEPAKTDKWQHEKNLKLNTVRIIQNSNACPFKWLKNKYQCFCCRKTFAEFKSLREHTANHSRIDVKNVITRYNTLLYHKVEISDLKCNICCQSQESVITLRDHLVKHHSLIFEKEGDLLISFKLANGFQCALCTESFLVFHKLNIHMNEHYQNFICETCGAGFANHSNMRGHSLRHETKPNVCKECQIEFANAYQKELHDSQVHRKTAKRVCPSCGERFNGHYSRLVHMVTVHGEKKPEFKCNSCERVFLRKYLLNSHVRKFHMREKRHECDVCPYKFFNKSDLRNHMTTHTGVKNYVCSVCGKSYSRKSRLTCHLKSHNSKGSTN